MQINKKQSEAYLEESKLSLEAAKTLFENSEKNNRNLWAQIVKISYDSIEQAISSALAFKGQVIPKDHPAKISKFLNTYKINEKIQKILFYWLKKRSSSQYVDIKDNKVMIPSKIFDKKDAEKIIRDCEEIIHFTEQLTK